MTLGYVCGPKVTSKSLVRWQKIRVCSRKCGNGREVGVMEGRGHKPREHANAWTLENMKKRLCLSLPGNIVCQKPSTLVPNF